MSSTYEPTATAQHFQSPSPRINTPTDDDTPNPFNHHHHHYNPDDCIPGNPHMLKIASHTAYRSAARSPASILSKKASWVDTSRNISLSPKNLSRPTSASNSPVGTPIGTPRNRSPVRGFATSAGRMGKQDGVKNEPPKHEMTVFEGLLSERRRFGDFRRVLHTGLYSQLVAMEIPPNGDIGEEVHSVDQTLLFTHGRGLAQVAGVDRPVKAGDVVIVPAGTRHQFLNTSADEPLELVTVYAPAEHDPRSVHKTKQEGDQEEEDGVDVAPKWARRSQKENAEAGLVKMEGGPYEE